MLTNAQNYELIRDAIIMLEMMGYKVTIDSKLNGTKCFVVHPENIKLQDEVNKYSVEILKNFPHANDSSELWVIRKTIEMVKANNSNIDKYKKELEKLVKEKVSPGYDTMHAFCNHTGLGEQDIKKAIACCITPEELYSQWTDHLIEKND